MSIEKNFFERKKSVGIVIPKAGPFDEDQEDDILSCGLNAESFNERNKLMFDGQNGFDVPAGKNPVAVVSARLENHFSKREIAFFLATSMLSDVMNQVELAKKENGK